MKKRTAIRFIYNISRNIQVKWLLHADIIWVRTRILLTCYEICIVGHLRPQCPVTKCTWLLDLIPRLGISFEGTFAWKWKTWCSCCCCCCCCWFPQRFIFTLITSCLLCRTFHSLLWHCLAPLANLNKLSQVHNIAQWTK